MAFVWPAPGERPVKENGVTLYSSAGEDVAIDAYVSALLRAGQLRGFNPYGVSRPSYYQPGISTSKTALAFCIGSSHGQLVNTSGEVVVGDGDASPWVWMADSVLAIDGDDVLGYLDVGRWVRQWALTGLRVSVEGVTQPRRPIIDIIGAVGEDVPGENLTRVTYGGVSRLEIEDVGQVDNLAIYEATHVIWTGDGAVTLTGQTPSTLPVRHFKRGNGSLTIAHESASSTAANRFSLLGAADLVVPSAGVAETFYATGATPRNDAYLLAGAAASPPPADVLLQTVSGLDGTNLLGTAVNEGLRGHATAAWGRMLVALESQAVASADRRLIYLQTGYVVSTAGANATLNALLYRSGGTTVSATVTLTAGMVGKLLDIVWSHDGSFWSLWINGIAQGSPVAIATTPQVGNASYRMQVGHQHGGVLPADGWGLIALMGGDGYSVNDAEVLSMHNATVAAIAASTAPFVALSGKTTGLWDFSAAPNPPATVTDDIGSDDITVYSGAASGLAITDLTNPEFA